MTGTTLFTSTAGFNRIQNPFPGLRPFGIQESYLYFGREGQSDEIIEILSKNRFITILGSSGTGKSSLMFSGVIPSLHGGFMATVGAEWEVVTARPGLNPIENLALSLAKFEEEDKKPSKLERTANRFMYEAILRKSSRGLVDAFNAINKLEGKNLLIYLDQFEEIFRFRKQGNIRYLNESLAYVNLIIEAIVQREVPVFIALSMRSDFLGDCEQFPELTNKINESHFLIPQMTRDQKRLVVNGPIAVGNAAVSNRLVQRLLNDMGDRPDQLPVLQHALMRTWDYWQKNSKKSEPIDFLHYEAIGGVNEALSRHADEAYYELGDLEKEICERLFKTITEKRSDNDGIRRPTKLEEIAKIIDEDEDLIKKVIDKFREQGRALLMPPPEVELTGASVIDISHEALMRVWYRLRNWVDEESNSSKIYLRLAEASKNYQQGVGSLWRPPDLQLAIEWRNKTKPTLKWALQYDNNFENVISFLYESEEAYKLEIENKDRIQRKRLRQTRLVASVLGMAAMISIVMLVVAFNQKLEADFQKQQAEASSNEAKTNAEVAERNRQQALERLVQANQSTQLANLQKQRAEMSARLAEEAKFEAESERRAAVRSAYSAQIAEQNALDQQKIATREKENAQKSERNAYQLRMISIAKNLAFKSQQIEDEQLRALLAYTAFKFNRDNDGYQYDNDIFNGLFGAVGRVNPRQFEAFNGRASEVRSIHLTEAEKLYTNGSDGKIYEWNISNQGKETSKLIYDSKNQLLKKLTVNSNNNVLACLMNDANLYIKDLKSNEQGQVLRLPFNYAYDLSFVDNNDLLVSSSDSIIYRFTNQKAIPLIKTSGRIFTFKLFKSGQYLVSGSENGRVDIWDLRNNKFVANLYRKDKTVIHALAINERDNTIAFGDNQGHIQIIKLKDDLTAASVIDLAGHDNKIVSDMLFNEMNRQLISSSTDGSIYVWDVNDPDNFPIVISERPESWVLSIALNKDNGMLLAGCKERRFRNYPIESVTMAGTLRGMIKRDLTPEEWRRYVGEDIPYLSIFDNSSSSNE